MRAKYLFLGIALMWLWVITPFRLLALSAELPFVRPGITRLATTDGRYWDVLALEGRLMALGYTVGYAPGLRVEGVEALGLTNTGTHTILIDSTIHWDARYAVLAHEGGHVLAPAWVSTGHECFAEGVAMLVAHDGVRNHARYLAAAPWTCIGIYLTEFPSLYAAAAILSDS